MFGRTACLEGLLVWKACLFGKSACLEDSKSSKSLKSFVIVGLLSEQSLLVAEGAKIDQTLALPTKVSFQNTSILIS